MAARGESSLTGLPSMRISPASGWKTPLRHFTRTVLPAPLSPIRATTSFGYTVKLAPRRAWTLPNVLTTSWASSSGSVTHHLLRSAHPILRSVLVANITAGSGVSGWLGALLRGPSHLASPRSWEVILGASQARRKGFPGLAPGRGGSQRRRSEHLSGVTTGDVPRGLSVAKNVRDQWATNLGVHAEIEVQ